MSNKQHKILRVSTIPLSLKVFCKDLLQEISDEYEVLAVSSPGAELVELRKHGIPVKEVPMQREISPISDLRALWNLYRLFRKEKPQMVHSITPKAGLLSMTAALMAGVPVRVHSFSGLLFPTAKGLKRRILKFTDKMTCACATHILPEGEGVKNDLQNASITRKPLKVLGYGNIRGVDLNYYTPTDEIAAEGEKIRRNFGIPKDAFTFVFVGRIVRDKGINELVESFSKLCEANPDIHLILGGPIEKEGAPLAESTMELIATNKHIHLTANWINDVRPYYAAADTLVLPSYREGFPNVVLEAGAMGLPCIVTDISGSREIIIEGVNGTIIPSQNREALYDAMEGFLANRDRLAEMGQSARLNVEAKYEASYVRNCLKDFYRQTLSEKLSGAQVPKTEKTDNAEKSRSIVGTLTESMA